MHAHTCKFAHFLILLWRALCLKVLKVITRVTFSAASWPLVFGTLAHVSKTFNFLTHVELSPSTCFSLNVGSREKKMIEKLAGVQNINVKFEWYAYPGFRDFKKMQGICNESNVAEQLIRECSSTNEIMWLS